MMIILLQKKTFWRFSSITHIPNKNHYLQNIGKMSMMMKKHLLNYQMMKIMTIKSKTKKLLQAKKRKNNLCVHCQRYQIQEVVNSLVRGIYTFEAAPTFPSNLAQPLNISGLAILTSEFEISFWMIIVGKKCQDAANIL